MEIYIKYIICLIQIPISWESKIQIFKKFIGYVRLKARNIAMEHWNENFIRIPNLSDF